MLEAGGTVLLKGNGFAAGPGHNAEIITDDEGADWLLYHGYLHTNPELGRLVFLDRIMWNDDWPVLQRGVPSTSSVAPSFEPIEDY